VINVSKETFDTTPLVIFFLIFTGFGLGVVIWYIKEVYYKNGARKRECHETGE